ncbi:LacI family DNA-binding transcriptional regulator [Nakamurella sp. YIM 132087]|uniref:LacI family DNA-binding transcriptional regulator n=1 Tax=Nakamurella alba TaxID=2665158 RepID=A0A7K1FGM1_9ACTN|nr:LacI family DNA-binding transcriptional regulator [Nakamurella alba]MTD13210.1 LacI family DNA-binding transcriptional regulator [Nakamurella alba]
MLERRNAGTAECCNIGKARPYAAGVKRDPGNRDNGGAVAGRGSRVKATDVAKHAGVSIATVSLVANGKAEGRVSETTRQRVESSIRELGYVVNPSARSLVTGRYGRIALLAHDLTNPFIATVAAGVVEAAPADLQVLLGAGGAESAPPDVAMIASFGVDGMLLNLDDGEYDPELLDFPVVVVDEHEPRANASRVYFDLAHGTAMLAGHLAELGHRTVVYLDSTRPRSTFTSRRTHFRNQFRKVAVEGKVLRVRSGIDLNAAAEVTARSVDDWLAQGATAIVTATDVQAYGVLAGLAGAGIDVPGRMSVASFDNNLMSMITRPPLTSVDLSARALGREAVTLLVDEIARNGRPGRSVQLPTSLVVRGSTAPAPRRKVRQSRP